MPATRASAFVAASVIVVAAVFLWVTLPGAGQTAPLTIVNAGPRGEVGMGGDADQIRLAFSAPMVPLGTIPTSTAPPWIRIIPAAEGNWYWSGTKTLIFSPDVSTPLPFATTFTVHVDAAAASVDGWALGAPYEFTFSTPTPR